MKSRHLVTEDYTKSVRKFEGNVLPSNKNKIKKVKIMSNETLKQLVDYLMDENRYTNKDWNS